MYTHIHLAISFSPFNHGPVVARASRVVDDGFAWCLRRQWGRLWGKRGRAEPAWAIICQELSRRERVSVPTAQIAAIHRPFIFIPSYIPIHIHVWGVQGDPPPHNSTHTPYTTPSNSFNYNKQFIRSIRYTPTVSNCQRGAYFAQRHHLRAMPITDTSLINPISPQS